MRVRFLRPAEEEVSAVGDLDHAVALLAAHPEVGAPFDVAVDEVMVVAVLHQRQRPKSWRETPQGVGSGGIPPSPHPRPLARAMEAYADRLDVDKIREAGFPPEVVGRPLGRVVPTSYGS